jgi:PleD family two-component response regulator
MGNCFNKRVQSADVGKSVQDEAHSVRSKTSAFKLLFKSEGSRTSLLSYIKSNCKESKLLDYASCFQKIDELKKIDNDRLFYDESKQIYANLSGMKDSDINSRLMEKLGICVTKANSRFEIIQEFQLVQESMLLSLNPIFTEYLKSNEYNTWLKEEKSVEVSIGRKVNVYNGPITLSAHSELYSNVLIVDNSTTNLRMTGVMLSRAGHSIEKCADGCSALEKMKEGSFDIVLFSSISSSDIQPSEITKSFKKWKHEKTLKDENGI